MSVNGTSLSTIKLCDGRKGNIDTHDEQYESENLESARVAETRQALQPASFQSFALCPSSVHGKLVSTVVDRPVALRPTRLSATVVADDFSQSPVYLRPDGSEAIAQAAMLRSLPKSVVTQASGDGNRSPSVCLGGQKRIQLLLGWW